jgi:ketosteroid isomerase-like protein
MTKPQRANLEVLVGWLDAMRRGDLDAVAQVFDPGVTWQGLPTDAVCHDREEVLEMLGERLREGFPEAHALELIATENAVVLGISAAGLVEIGDVPLTEQLFNVFRIDDGRVVHVQDFARREDALRAADRGPG